MRRRQFETRKETVARDRVDATGTPSGLWRLRAYRKTNRRVAHKKQEAKNEQR